MACLDSNTYRGLFCGGGVVMNNYDKAMRRVVEIIGMSALYIYLGLLIGKAFRHSFTAGVLSVFLVCLAHSVWFASKEKDGNE